MANYDALKTNVDKNGEVMIGLNTEEKFELHKHNVEVRLNKKNRTSSYGISLPLSEGYIVDTIMIRLRLC